jgi:type I restriction enzyme S subunit
MMDTDARYWIDTTIGALGKLHCGQSPSSTDVNTEGRGTPYITGPEQWDGYKIVDSKWTTDPRRIAPANSIFITVKGSVGEMFPGTRAAIGRDIYAFEPAAGMSTKFIQYALQYSVQDVVRKARGDIPGLTKQHILDHPISIPGPKQQERIASRIDELFSRIEEGERALQRVQKLVERYRQSVLKAAVTGELTREWREQRRGQLESGEELLQRILKARREAWEKAELDKMKAKGVKPASDAWKQKYKEPSAADSTGLTQLPQGWVWALVEQLASKVVDGVHKKPTYVASGIPFVTVKNLTAGSGISFEGLHYITPEDHDEYCKRTDPERGDVLVSKDGTLGVVRLVQTDTVFSIFVSVALVKPIQRSMGEYLTIALSSPVVQAQMVPKGSGLQHIHLEDLRRDCVPLCSREEQLRIVNVVAAQLAQIDHLVSDVTLGDRQTATLRRSVLRAAFSGSLATQNPTDEPASTLLERIAAERDKLSATPKRRTRKMQAA